MLADAGLPKEFWGLAAKAKHALSPKGKKAVFVGYGEENGVKGWKVWDEAKAKVISSASVKFWEDDFQRQRSTNVMEDSGIPFDQPWTAVSAVREMTPVATTRHQPTYPSAHPSLYPPNRYTPVPHPVKAKSPDAGSQDDGSNGSDESDSDYHNQEEEEE
ncbi:hypothetical protein [Phaffia rhodozyma]|uniref:Retroviral polymerase SH3-like domain-containing protein n=1 Tax=Phaffia rhodozyma TaxID=264483 RepID=A0A0F7SV53_PHARH|nr:hypothetical protein [Phaffia rhodozyma]